MSQMRTCSLARLINSGGDHSRNVKRYREGEYMCAECFKLFRAKELQVYKLENGSVSILPSSSGERCRIIGFHQGERRPNYSKPIVVEVNFPDSPEQERSALERSPQSPLALLDEDDLQLYEQESQTRESVTSQVEELDCWRELKSSLECVRQDDRDFLRVRKRKIEDILDDFKSKIQCSFRAQETQNKALVLKNEQLRMDIENLRNEIRKVAEAQNQIAPRLLDLVQNCGHADQQSNEEH